MGKGKAADVKGLVVEMLQAGSDVLLDCVAQLFTKIFQQQGSHPDAWDNSLVTVLFKKGDPQMPGNYRPITLLPILYKLFSRILRERIQPILDKSQCVDQAGFRKGFNCDDHLLAMTLLIERCSEFQLP
eukprot:7922668-Karenia_brevis.AAC.1